MGELQVRIWLGVVRNLAGNVLHVTTYIDKCIRGVLPLERKIVFEHSALFAVLGSDTETDMTMVFLREASME